MERISSGFCVMILAICAVWPASTVCRASHSGSCVSKRVYPLKSMVRLRHSRVRLASLWPTQVYKAVSDYK